jgi:hypothetical protein
MDILTLLVEKAPQCLHDLLTAEILSHTVAALIDGSLPDGAKEQAARALMLMSLAGDASAQGRICGGAAVAAITACMHAETTAKCRTYCAQALHALAAHASSMSVLVAAEVPMHLEQTLARAADGSEVHSAAVSALGMLTRHAIEGSDAEAMAALLRHNTPEGKREVLKALRRVAESGERAEELVGAGLVRLLVDVVRTTDGRWESGGAGEDAICTLAQLAAAEACRAELVEGDVLKLLISVLRSVKAETGPKEAAIAVLHKIICVPSFVPSRLSAEDFMLFLTLTRVAEAGVTDLSASTQQALGDITERLVEFFAPSLINSIETLLELVSLLGCKRRLRLGFRCLRTGSGVGRKLAVGGAMPVCVCVSAASCAHLCVVCMQLASVPSMEGGVVCD